MTDWDKVERIGRELEHLHESGLLTLDDFTRLYVAADRAGAGDALEMFSPLAQDRSWLEWIRRYHSRGRNPAKVA